MVRPRYPVTKLAVEAVERGMAAKGWTDAELARAIKKTRQAVGQVLSMTTKRSEILADMLKAVGEPQYLVFDLSELDVEMLNISKRVAQLPLEAQREYIAEMRRRAEGELARLELAEARRFEKPSTDH